MQDALNGKTATRYRCPRCGAVLETEEAVEGLSVTCPECGGEFTATSRNDGGSMQCRCPRCGAILEADQPIEGQAVTCPACGYGFVAAAISSAPARPPAGKKGRLLRKVVLGLVVAAVGYVLACVVMCFLSERFGWGKRAAGSTKTITLPGGAAMEMVWCPGGLFPEGASLEDKRIDGFWIAKYEVTQGQWTSVMGNNPSYFQGEYSPVPPSEEAYLPVEDVKWDECMDFCRKAGLDLPTEEQWEYACLAGSDEKLTVSPATGWYGESQRNGHTHPVGQKQPNAWGIYDMLGNVREWCADPGMNRGGGWSDWTCNSRDSKYTNPDRPITYGQFTMSPSVHGFRPVSYRCKAKDARE